MKNLTQMGYSMAYTNTSAAAIASGDVVRVGNVLTIAAVDIPANGTGTVDFGCVFTVKCKATDTITQGMLLDWDASAKQFVADIGTAASGDVKDCALAVKDDDGATVDALLLRSGGPLTA